MVTDVIYGSLQVGGGAYLFLAATGRMQISADPEHARRWQETWGRSAKWGCPIMVFLGAIRLANIFFI